ncbi:hypothetical protein FNZ56_04140 [Pseudoluteimonas lycopersici]|uniref:Uncharacterized protein n=1 Tax=Pseudoluteimonas lycopersici TaxID=1324796 RepID=A0A516V3L5_9GAMM|nr:hypothetical protein [Lysobacter lycopersici]QDQ73120.1 hypothetical protein FNZ56_04140 [Lysobacter lycopersici]
MAEDDADFNHRRWFADTPTALIAKHDVEGIDRSRLRLDTYEDGGHDHSLGPEAVAEFRAALGVKTL